MKKVYLNPEIEVVELDMVNNLLAGSLPEGGEGDGGIIPGTPDPSDPDWGSDY
jgi:hypothetical protein